MFWRSREKLNTGLRNDSSIGDHLFQARHPVTDCRIAWIFFGDYLKSFDNRLTTVFERVAVGHQLVVSNPNFAMSSLVKKHGIYGKFQDSCRFEVSYLFDQFV